MPWIDGTKEEIIFNPTKSEVTPKAIELGSHLPDEMLAVIELLSPELPPVWRQKAAEAAYYIYSFDFGLDLVKSGVSLEQNKHDFARKLTQTGFCSYAVGMRVHKDAVSPQWDNWTNWINSVPDWLVNHYYPTTSNFKKHPERLQALERLWTDYLVQRGHIARNYDGEYIIFEDADHRPDDPLLRAFGSGKVYVEGIDDGQGLSDADVLHDLFEKLKSEHLHPYEMKMHRDDMMVLYFDMMKGDRSEAIQKVFDKTKIPFRGPAQDKRVLKLKPEGGQEVLKLDSNDNCWNSPVWMEKEYQPDVFLRRYLEIAFRGYKDPTRPFMSGLLPVSIGESGLHPDSLKTQGPINDLANRLDLPLFIYSEVPKSPFKSSQSK